MNRLLAWADKWHTLYLLLFLTGLCHGEAKKLIWADIHFGEKPLLQQRAEATKSVRADTIPLNSTLARELEAYRPPYWKPEMRVFHKGVAMNSTLKRDLVKARLPLIDEYGRPVGFYTFRRTFVTLGQQLGIAPRVVQQLARHRKSELTDWTYTDTTKLDTHGAVERLGAFLNSPSKNTQRNTQSEQAKTGKTCPSQAKRKILNQKMPIQNPMVLNKLDQLWPRLSKLVQVAIWW